MTLLEQIQSGRQPMPRRVMLYGTHGIGKSTFGSMAETPVFIQTEDGLGEIDCDKLPIATRYGDVLAALSELYSAEHNYKTVVVDSLDWLERLIFAEVCAKRGVESIEDIGYAKGYTFALTQWREILEGLDALRNERGMQVILIAHARIEKFDNPETESYDRYVPRLNKHASALVQEWCDEVLGRFRSGALKYLCNVNVLTTGFDAPHIDCIAMVRPTLSPGLYYQMVGRGFRIDPGKTDCLVLDFGGNVIRHGPVDDIRITEPNAGDGDAPAKECPDCQALIHAAYAVCPVCGHEFPEREESTHDAQASTEGILSGQTTRTVQRVQNVFFSVHTKRDASPDAPQTMRVEYQLGFNEYASEWICVEHTGYARAKAESWWHARSNEPAPDSAEEAVVLAEAGALAETRSITVKRTVGEKYDCIVDWDLGPRPGALPEPEYVYVDDCEVPF